MDESFWRHQGEDVEFIEDSEVSSEDEEDGNRVDTSDPSQLIQFYKGESVHLAEKLSKIDFQGLDLNFSKDIPKQIVEKVSESAALVKGWYI